jgi:type IV pilus assembly protein PilA
MKKSFARLWRSAPHPQSGFTLLELLVVIIIVGLLSAMALPSFLRQTNRAREAEARTYVAAINRGQQAYFTENLDFGNLADLELSLSDSQSYIYDSQPNGADDKRTANTTATPRGGVTRGFAGKVWLVPDSGGTITSWSVVCEGGDGVVPAIAETTCP